MNIKKFKVSTKSLIIIITTYSSTSIINSQKVENNSQKVKDENHDIMHGL